jgi:DNA (cytosine-5)-methyltransferase 1
MYKDGGSPAEYARNEIPLAAQVVGPLNPEWVEWLMGWPQEWTDLKPLATDKFHKWSQQYGEN